jgi:CysZ protein
MPRFISAFLLPFNGLSLILRPGLRRYAVMPVMLSVLLYAGTAWGAYAFFDNLIARYLPQEGLWSYLAWLVWPVVVIAYVLIAFFTFTVLANLVGSPFNGLLAARVEQHLTGAAPTERDGPLWREVAPAIWGEVLKLAYFLTRAIPVLFLLLIPGIHVFAAILWILLGWWFLAVEYCDYPMGNHRMTPSRQRQTLRAHRLGALAFGAGGMVLMMIPGLQLAAMPAMVAGATRFWVDDLGG